MKHLFLNYELSVIAKEKGFNEHCLGWHIDPVNFVLDEESDGWDLTKATPALLYQQIVDWLREKHNLHIYIDTTPIFDKMQGSKYKTTIRVPFEPFKWTTAHYYLGNNYYEALNKAIEEAFKLIP